MCRGGRRPSAGDDGGDEAPDFDRLLPILRIYLSAFATRVSELAKPQAENYSGLCNGVADALLLSLSPRPVASDSQRSRTPVARTQCCEPSPSTSAPSTFMITRRGVPTVKAWTQAFAPATRTEARFGLAARGPLTRPRVFDIGTRLEPP